jgi:hypothetical protein
MESPSTFILATRFSWPHPIWQSRSKGEYLSWIERRFELFERYTARSVANCYIKPDYWVLLIGENQGDISSRLQNMLSHLDCNVIIAPYFGASLSLTIMQSLKDLEYPARIVTSNLDADDMISSDFFAVLKSICFLNHGNTAVSFCSGANYMVEDGTFYLSSYPGNPFLSLYETCRGPHDAQTVYFKMHTELMSFVKHMILPRSYYPMWASVIHENNLANRSLIETNRISFSENTLLNKRFGISQENI